MKSSWKDSEAQALNNDLLKLRVYTSRLLGSDEDLVLHGGGNTSVKIKETNIFGEEEDILYVKGSGWDLATIEEAGFAPVKLDALYKLAELDTLSDTQMVKYQRMAMTNPSAPNPSVETILHGIIPYTFVDHTHADAVVIVTNTDNGEERIKEIYGDSVLIVPYVMPGFILAKTIYEMTRGIDWEKLEGMILLNHGVFTFNHDPKKSYEKMIEIVSKAEDYIKDQGIGQIDDSSPKNIDHLRLAQIRKSVSDLAGKPSILSVVPSLDTGVCQVQTKRFNEELGAMGESVNAVTISCDLPFAQNRFCGAEEVKNMKVGSDYQNGAFGADYGVMIDELKLHTRSVFVLDSQGNVVYSEIVPEVTEEPNYEAALAALKSAS